MNKFALADGSTLTTPHTWETLVCSGQYKPVINPEAKEAALAFESALDAAYWQLVIELSDWLLDVANFPPSQIKNQTASLTAARNIIEAAVMLHFRNPDVKDYTYRDKNRACLELFGASTNTKKLIQSASMYDGQQWPVTEDIEVLRAEVASRRAVDDDDEEWVKEDAALFNETCPLALLKKHFDAKNTWECKHCRASTSANGNDRIVYKHYKSCPKWPVVRHPDVMIATDDSKAYYLEGKCNVLITENNGHHGSSKHFVCHLAPGHQGLHSTIPNAPNPDSKACLDLNCKHRK